MKKMLKYIIRLDDACPWMQKDKWDKMENLLNKYNIKPIVGLIPNCKDKLFLQNKKIPNFWQDYPVRWQKNNWIIAQHGFSHNLNEEIRTEFAGKKCEEQKEILLTGYNILVENGVRPTCFFAPAHTFDDNTVKACLSLDCFDFISDGYAFYPYNYLGMLFIPSIFDTPHKITNDGIFTFVYHPNSMKEEDFNYLEKFINEHVDNFNIDIENIINTYMNRKRSFKDKLVQLLINLYRKIKGTRR